MKISSITKVAQFTGHRDAIYTLSEALDSSHFYTGAADGMVVEWNHQTPGDGVLLVKVPTPVYSLCLNADEKLLYVGTREGNLHVVDLQSRQEIRNIAAHAGGIFDMRILPDQRLVTCGGDGKVCIWSLPDFTLVSQLNHSEKSARVSAYNEINGLLAIGYSDHRIRVFSLHNFEYIANIDGHTNSVFALSFSPNGQYLLSGGRDAVLRIWNVQQEFKPEKEIPAHWYHINHITYNCEGSWYATCSLDKTVKVWDANTFELLKVIDKARHEAHSTSINKILWIDANAFISCSDDRTAMLFRLETEL